jgi:hydroxycarboxylate dehydrogenase B
MTVVVQADRLEDLIGEIFSAAGCSDAESTRVARRLVSANLTGHDSHGVVRTQRYVQSLAAGAQVADATVEVMVDGDAFAVVDGCFGMGQTVGEQAVQLGIDKARAHGVAVVALRHAGHLGRIGDWAEMAALAGIVSIHFVNVAGGLLVAPFGGAERRMGTNPVAIGVPRPGEAPVVLDFATSVVAEGKALVALDGGPAVPKGSLITDDGDLSDDPAVLYGEVRPGSVPDPRRGPGALRAMGEHKGSGLSMMCELLAGVLTGSGTAEERRFCNGMLSVYLTPEAFGSGDDFAAGVRQYVDWFRSARPARGSTEVLAPGEPEQRRRAERLENGITLPDGTWASIQAAAVEVGLDGTKVSQVATPA